jgi:hypothetical protein
MNEEKLVRCCRADSLECLLINATGESCCHIEPHLLRTDCKTWCGRIHKQMVSYCFEVKEKKDE